MIPTDYTWNVFINCPFDPEYEPIFHAIIFAVFDCGYVPRSALENQDCSDVRIQKIYNIIKSCKYAIHDISRTDPSSSKGLPRFNMPLELGLFLGAKYYGNKLQKSKSCLILDKEQYRYQIFISDIAGQDIRAHDNQPEKAILHVRDWLSSHLKDLRYPGGNEIFKRYQLFRKDLPEICKEVKQSPEVLTFNDYAYALSAWLKLNGNEI
jgi:hypothetical protein